MLAFLKMGKTKLWIWLLTLSAQELNKFSLYLASLYYNDKAVLTQFFGLLKPVLERALRKQKAQIPTNEGVWAALFGNNAFDNVRLNRITSELNQHLEDFLLVEHRKKDTESRDIALLEMLQTQRLDDFFIKKQADFIQKQTTKPIQNRSKYTHDWLLHECVDSFFDRQIERAPQTNVVAAAASLDKMFIVEKLRYACNAFNYARVMRVDLPIEGVAWLLHQRLQN